jgi:hypothetical protein
LATRERSVGEGVGASGGDDVGDPVVAGVGDTVGDGVGDSVGDDIGDPVGAGVGGAVGDGVGDFVGDAVGDPVGSGVGDSVGDGVRGFAAALSRRREQLKFRYQISRETQARTLHRGSGGARESVRRQLRQALSNDR